MGTSAHNLSGIIYLKYWQRELPKPGGRYYLMLEINL